MGLFFRKVRDTALRESNGYQEPFTYGSLGAEPFYFSRMEPNSDPEIGTISTLEVLDSSGPTSIAIPKPTDPDSDPLSIEVVALPLSGDVKVSDRAILIGDTLTVAQMDALTYEPDGIFAGDAGTFSFVVSDGRDGVVAASVPVVVSASNKPPRVDNDKTLTVSPVPFSLSELTDPDGDPLLVTVLSVPISGCVRISDKTIVASDTIAPSEVHLRRYDPEIGFEGYAGALVIETTDGRGGRGVTSIEVNVVATPVEPDRMVVASIEPNGDVTRAISGGETSEHEASANTDLSDDASEEPSSIYRASTASNVRENPTVRSERVGFLEPNEEVEVTGPPKAEGNWLPIRKKDGKIGYVASRLLDKVPTVASNGAGDPQPDTPD